MSLICGGISVVVNDWFIVATVKMCKESWTKYSFIPYHLARTIMDLKPIPPTLGSRREYTLIGIPKIVLLKGILLVKDTGLL